MCDAEHFLFSLRQSFDNLADDDTSDVGLVTFPEEDDMAMVGTDENKRVRRLFEPFEFFRTKICKIFPSLLLIAVDSRR